MGAPVAATAESAPPPLAEPSDKSALLPGQGRGPGQLSGTLVRYAGFQDAARAVS